jgi:hypothetical protein
MKRFRPVAQEDDSGCGAACVASALGLSYAEVVAKLAGKAVPKSRKKRCGPEGEALRRVLNEALKNTGLIYDIDGPFIGDPNSLETGSIVSLENGHYLMRSAEGWMDPANAKKVRKRLPAKVHQALVLTPDYD